jgi:enediyne biosynthesis protein E4
MFSFRSRCSLRSHRSPPVFRRRRRTWRTNRLLMAGALLGLFGGTAAIVGIVRPWEAQRPYVPGERAEGITSSLEREAPGEAPTVLFTDEAAEAGIGFQHFHGARSVQLPEDMGSGVAWGDYDGDGDDDLVLVNIAGPMTERSGWAASPAATRLYRNDGGGRFTDVTEAAGVGFRGLGMAATWADYDGDGDLDLLLTADGELRLYRNDGGVFRDVTMEAGLDAKGFFSGASWADYDRDGDLDLYVCRYVRYDLANEDPRKASRHFDTLVPFALNPSSFPPAPNVLYRNEGHGRFTDVTAEAGVANETGRSLSAVWSDFDEDGWPDLYVANDVSDNALYHNRGDGTFADMSHEAWVADYRGAMGLAVGDPDNDGDPDIFITHWIAQENALYRNLLGDLPMQRGEKAPPLRFIDEADQKGLGQSTVDFIGWGTAFFDYDLDGWLDLFVANGSTFQDDRTPPGLVPMRQQLFWNQGGGRGFFEVGARSGPFFAKELVGRGAAVSDYDGDGDPDVALLVHSGRAVLLRNDGHTGHHFLEVRLVGRGANRFAIGARLRLEAGGRLQSREIAAGGSYLSQNSLTALFGLGPAAAVDRLEVRWPSGRTELYAHLPVDQAIVLAEGSGQEVEDRARVQRFWAAYREALSAKEAARWEEAVRLFSEALALDPGHQNSLYFLGTSLFELGRYAEAGRAWRRLVEIAPGSAPGHFQLGNLHSCPEPGTPWDLAAAEREMQRVQQLNPEQTGPLARLAEIALARGELGRASELFEKVIRTNQADAGSWYLLGYIRFLQGRSVEAAGLLGHAAAAIQGQSPVRGILGEGDSSARLQTTFPRKRLFAALWLDLQDKGYGDSPSAGQAEAEYHGARAYHEALAGRLSGVSAPASVQGGSR